MSENSDSHDGDEDEKHHDDDSKRGCKPKPNKDSLRTNDTSTKSQVTNDKLINHSPFLHDRSKKMCRLNCEPSDSFDDNRLKTQDHCSKTIILNENSSCAAKNHHLASNHSTNT